MKKESDISYETPCGKYWIYNKGCKKGSKGYEVYKTGLTHSTRCAIIGYKGEIGLERALKEIERRLKEENNC